MVAYKLSKNGWVLTFFVIFRLAREKLLVTVTLDHPVSIQALVTVPVPVPVQVLVRCNMALILNCDNCNMISCTL